MLMAAGWLSGFLLLQPLLVIFGPVGKWPWSCVPALCNKRMPLLWRRGASSSHAVGLRGLGSATTSTNASSSLLANSSTGVTPLSWSSSAVPPPPAGGAAGASAQMRSRAVLPTVVEGDGVDGGGEGGVNDESPVYNTVESPLSRGL